MVLQSCPTRFIRDYQSLWLQDLSMDDSTSQGSEAQINTIVYTPSKWLHLVGRLYVLWSKKGGEYSLYNKIPSSLFLSLVEISNGTDWGQSWNQGQIQARPWLLSLLWNRDNHLEGVTSLDRMFYRAGLCLPLPWIVRNTRWVEENWNLNDMRGGYRPRS